MNSLKAYALAVVSVGVALALTLAIHPVRDRSPYLLLTMGIMLSANQGLGPGVFATLLSTALTAYFLIPPVYTFAISGPEDLVPLSLFCLVGFSVTWISHRLRLSKAKLLEANLTLSESEEKYRTLAEETEVERRELESILDSMNDGLVVVDQRGNPLMMNPAAWKMHGYPDASAARAPLHQVAGVFELRDGSGNAIPPERWPGSRALTGEIVRNLELEVVRRDSEKRFVGYYNAVPVRDQSGQIKLAVITITDITESKRMEQRLRDAQKLEGIGLLAGGIAHDFNNLLTGVLASASMALDIVPPSSPAVDLLRGILKTSDQLAHLTKQMLAYSGKGRYVLEQLNLSNLILEMSPLVQPSISRKVELRLELEPGLPPIEADRGQMQQVFMNLSLNAAEAIGAEAGLITVKTGLLNNVDGSHAADVRPGKYVYLEVRDTGCGMDDATKARMFDPFFSTKFVGRGLGLAAVSGIVRGHKGAIDVATSPGKGTCFTILFPVAEDVVAPAPAADHQADLAGTGTILFVDD